jgi:hypothetical protein
VYGIERQPGIQADVGRERVRRPDEQRIGLGDLQSAEADHFFLDNPVWTWPLIKLGGGRFFCALPQTFFSFIFAILDNLLAGNESARAEYQRRRSDYLETQIAKLLSEAFPGCEISRGYKWSEDGTFYENDVLVHVDSHLILVEAKSGSISWPALRGAPDRARKHVEELLLAPSAQSFRLARRIEEVIVSPDRAAQLLPDFPVNLTRVRTVLRLSVTLEDFAVLQSNLGMVKEAGWVSDPDHTLAPCLLLVDLEIVMDILEFTALKLHYLKRRSELQANLRYRGDELDLLALYLQTGFNIGELEFNGTCLELMWMSEIIDNYYTALAEGVRGKRPQPRLTEMWNDICARMEERNFHQWSDVAMAILGVSYDDQQKLQQSFKKIRKNVLKKWREPKHHCSVILTPPLFCSDAFALYAFRERDNEERRERMRDIAEQVFVSAHIKRCVILGVNIDRADYPYSTLAVFFNGDPAGPVQHSPH